MLNALSLTRAGFTDTFDLIISIKPIGAEEQVDTHALHLRQAGNRPLAHFCGSIERGDVRILGERLADNVHSELLRRFDVRSRVFEARRSSRVGGYGDRNEGRVVRDLL